MRIAIISDTHGMWRKEIEAYLSQCNRIIHAGDIGSKDILDKLNEIAPTIAVCGNNDTGEWAKELPFSYKEVIQDHSFYVIHNKKDIKDEKELDGVTIVISGHSHRYEYIKKGQMLFLNPGGVGPKRFSLPVTFVILQIDRDNLIIQKHTIDGENVTIQQFL